MARYLVVAHQTAGSPELRQHVAKLVRTEPGSEFTVLVPATPATHMFAWREEESLSIAEEHLQRSAALLREAGANVTRTVIGSRFPVDAIGDELRDSAGYDAVIICTFPPGVSRWLRLDLIAQAERRSGLPVTHVIARPEPRSAPRREPVAVAAEGSTSAGAAVADRPADGSEAATSAPAKDLAFEHASVAEEEIGRLQLPHLEREDLPDESRELWDRLDEGRGVSHLLRTMGHNRTLLHSYAEMLNSLWNESGLDDQTRELAVLRTALVLRSAYVWHHHARIGRELGIPDERIAALEHWNSSERVHFDERERAVLAYVDALANRRRPPRRVHETLTRYYPPDAIVGLTLLVGFTCMTGMFADSLQVEPEERFVGWQLY